MSGEIKVESCGLWPLVPDSGDPSLPFRPTFSLLFLWYCSIIWLSGRRHHHGKCSRVCDHGWGCGHASYPLVLCRLFLIVGCGHSYEGVLELLLVCQCC
jgi:hypothetical protein